MKNNIQKTIIQQFRSEPQETFNRICKHNVETEEKQKYLNTQKQNIQAKLQIVFPAIIMFKELDFKQSGRHVPRPPKYGKYGIKLKFPIYHRIFTSVYYLIGYEEKGIWNEFGEAYKELLPNSSIMNRSQINNVDNLQQFIDSGMQVRVLIQAEIDNSKVGRFKKMLLQQKVIEACIESKGQVISEIKSPKIRCVGSIQRLFEVEVKKLIKKSCRSSLQFNFIEIDSKSPQVFKRKNLIQVCIEPKSKQQYLQNFQHFKIMIKDLDNAKILKKIEKEHINRTPQSSKLFKQNEQKHRKMIEDIHRQQQQFCLQFQKQIKQKNPIEKHASRQKILISLIQQYKAQHSIYGILNNTIRHSISINQTKMKNISTVVKYMHESIKYFFIKQIKNEIIKKKKIKQVYRAALLPLQEINELKKNQCLFNIGFMSTSAERKIADGFRKENGDNQNSYMFEIELGDYDQDLADIEDQPGFFYIPEQFKNLQIKERLKEEEVLFNPLNIFKILQIDKTKKFMRLQYSPHAKLKKKLKQKKLTTQQQKQYETMLTTMRDLNQSNYDKGQKLWQSGKVSQAIDYYKKIEEIGQTTTVDQKINYLEILTETKNHALAESQIKKMISDKANIKNSEEKQLFQIKILEKQSQQNQFASKFVQAEQKAKKAKKKLQDLFTKNKVNNSKSNNQIMLMLLTKVETLTLLAHSRLQTNQYQKSIVDAYVGFNVLDKVYEIYDECILKEVGGIVGHEQIVDKENKYQNLVYVCKCKNYKKGQNQQKLIQTDLIMKQQNEIRKQFEKKDLQGKQKTLSQYFNKRAIKDHYMKFYNASFEIQSYNCGSVELKQLKKFLLTQKRNLKDLFNLQMKLFQLMKKNTKSLNKLVVQQCLKNQKNNFYNARFSKFMKNNEKQINIDSVKYKSKFHQFVVQYFHELPYQLSNNQQNQLQKTLASLQQLTKVVQDQSNKLNQAFSIEKTYIVQAQTSYYKYCCLQSDIIEKAAAYHRMNKQHKFHTVSQCRQKKKYKELKKKLENLQKTHQKDNSINKFSFVLKDIVDQVSIMNDCYNGCDSYGCELEQANNKIEYFQTKYKSSLQESLLNGSQQLAELYYVKAQNKLRRGIYKEAQIQLKNAKDMLQKIYGSQQNNKLYARLISIKCCKLQAELVGIYCNYAQRAQSLKRLMRIKELCRNMLCSPNNYALINEAVAFVAIRCLPNEVTTFNSQLSVTERYKIGEQALKTSIELRKSSLGDENSYLAIDYSNMIILCAHKKPTIEQIKEYYEKGKIVYEKLKEQMKIEPILYVYQMILCVNYEKSRKEIDAKEISNIYRKCGLQYIQNAKNIRAVLVAEEFYKAAVHFAQYDKDDIENVIKFLQRAYIDVTLIQKLNYLGNRSSEIVKLQQKIKNLLDKFNKHKKGKIKSSNEIVEEEPRQKDFKCLGCYKSK